MYMIYGPAGSGKSTQGQILAEKLHGTWLSAGEISRKHFVEYTHTATMVPEDDLAKAILAEIETVEAKGPVVFDGQPWSPQGARILHQICVLARVQNLFVLDVPREVSLQRLGLRGRDDDSMDNWNRKLDMYEDRIIPFLNTLAEYNVPITHIDGEGTPAEVTERLLTQLVEEAHQ